LPQLISFSCGLFRLCVVVGPFAVTEPRSSGVRIFVQTPDFFASLSTCRGAWLPLLLPRPPPFFLASRSLPRFSPALCGAAPQDIFHPRVEPISCFAFAAGILLSLLPRPLPQRNLPFFVALLRYEEAVAGSISRPRATFPFSPPPCSKWLFFCCSSCFMPGFD